MDLKLVNDVPFGVEKEAQGDEAEDMCGYRAAVSAGAAD
jgi:hypothetical protein